MCSSGFRPAFSALFCAQGVPAAAVVTCYLRYVIDPTRIARAAWGPGLWIVPALVLLPAATAHAQRVPEEFLWFAGASVFAPFVAVPVKHAMLRLMALEISARRLWQISALEWLLWFPLAFVLLRSGRSSSAPLTLIAVFCAAAWLHGAILPMTRWRSAFLLSLPTPILAPALPLLALLSAAFLEWLAA